MSIPQLPNKIYNYLFGAFKGFVHNGGAALKIEQKKNASEKTLKALRPDYKRILAYRAGVVSLCKKNRKAAIKICRDSGYNVK